jgi:hypothetical protein
MGVGRAKQLQPRGDAQAVLMRWHAREMHAEGIMCKAQHSTARRGQGTHWLVDEREADQSGGRELGLPAIYRVWGASA